MSSGRDLQRRREEATQSQPSMEVGRPVAREQRKGSYRTPTLTSYGSLYELTRSGAGFGPDLSFGSGAPGT